MFRNAPGTALMGVVCGKDMVMELSSWCERGKRVARALQRSVGTRRWAKAWFEETQVGATMHERQGARSVEKLTAIADAFASC